ncbi:MAG: HEPN domain-containing protein [Promethearchaeota archaeon]
MVENTTKAMDWFKMVVSDITVSIDNYSNRHYPAAIYTVQQACEKALKGLLTLLGIQFGKTHFPSVILQRYLSTVKMDPDTSKKSSKIIGLAKTLERERELPRYGLEEDDKIITPQELYTKEDAEHILNTGLLILYEIVDIIKKNYSNAPDLLKICSDLEKEVKRINGLI